MPPRPAPDLDLRRTRVVEAARAIAEADGWAAVTMRRLAERLDATQPVLYTAFDGRQAVMDAVAYQGFAELAAALAADQPALLPRMRAYLEFALEHPRTYEAMFSMPSELHFASEQTPQPLRAAFTAIRDVTAREDDTAAEVVWAALHGLATLQLAGRMPADRLERRIELLHRALTALDPDQDRRSMADRNAVHEDRNPSP